MRKEAPLSMGIFQARNWSGLPCPRPGHLPNPGIKPMFLMSPALAGGFFTTSTTWEAPKKHMFCAKLLQLCLTLRPYGL